MPVTPIEVAGHPPNNITYSQAARLGDLIFVSGQLGVDPVTRQLVEGGIQAQTRQAIANIATVLAAAGSSLDRVVKVTVFITDFGLLREMNEVYGPMFPHRPAKTGVEISRLDMGAMIEIEVIAEAGES
jgi:2-iminobutanoate/2-iminopropanoate deaminase